MTLLQHQQHTQIILKMYDDSIEIILLLFESRV